MMELVRAGKIAPIPVEMRPLDQADKTLNHCAKARSSSASFSSRRTHAWREMSTRLGNHRPARSLVRRALEPGVRADDHAGTTPRILRLWRRRYRACCNGSTRISAPALNRPRWISAAASALDLRHGEDRPCGLGYDVAQSMLALARERRPRMRNSRRACRPGRSRGSTPTSSSSTSRRPKACA